MRVRALINRMAGSAIGESADGLERIVDAAFSSAGHAVSTDSIEPARLDEAIRDAVAGAYDAVIVGGGDGTIRGAARHLMNSDTALGVIPLGTFNRLARELEIPLDPSEAAAALATASPHLIDVGRVNERIFLCNSLIGLPTQFAQQRQVLRGQPLGERIVGYWQAIQAIVRSRRRLILTVDDGNESRKLRVLSVVISNNPYSEEAELGLRRPALDTKQLGFYLSQHRSALGTLRVLGRAFLGRWDGDPALERGVARKIVIDSRRSKLRVSNDGELEHLQTPLRYEILPGALKLLRPGA